MKLNRLAVCVMVASTLLQPFLVFGATDADLLAASSPVLAARPSSRQFVPSGRAVVTVNGQPVDFQGKFIFQIGGRLMVPLRPIGEALGANVSFNSSTTTATASRAGFRLTLREGVTTISGSTLISLRTLAESLGTDVSVVNTAGLTKIAVTTLPSDDSKVTNIGRPTRSPAPVQTGGGDDTNASNIQYNLKQLNALRARAGAPPLKLDERLNSFAREGSLELMRTHVPHGHFKSADIWNSGFENAAAENQGDPNGWFPGPTNGSIDQILKAMMDEGPGGGHHDNILNRAYHRVGIGLIKDAKGRLYFTNDFSG